MLSDAKFRDTMSTVQLWWIDVPSHGGFGGNMNYHETLGYLLDHTRSHRSDSTLVVTVRRQRLGRRSQTFRASRGIRFRHALRPCTRTIHCTCQYGFEQHHRLDFFTRHVTAQNSPCKHADSPHTSATEAMLASMVEQWSFYHLTHLHLEPAQGSRGMGALESTMGPRVYALTPPRLLHSSDTLHEPLSQLGAKRGESEGRAQRPPDSSFLRDDTLPLEQPTGTRAIPQSNTSTLFKCFLGTTTSTCSLLSTEAVPPTQTSDRTFDIHAPCDLLFTANSTRLISAGLSIGLPTGTTGRIELSSHSKFPDSVLVTLGLLDSSTVNEIYVVIANTGSTDFLLASGNVLAQLCLLSNTLTTESTSTNVVAFPTDSKVREQEARRAAKEAGHEITKVKQKKFVQDHTDDCGEDMSSIGASEILLNHQWVDQSDSSDSGGDLSETVADGLAYTMFYGPCADLHCYICNLQVFVARDVDELVLVAQRNGHSTFDLAEVCGGQGRTCSPTQIASRRKL